MIRMFNADTYLNRRKKLHGTMKNGLAIFPGNYESPMNYPANSFHFRQDSNFLYFFGLDQTGLNAIMDFDSGEDILIGDDLTIDDIIWEGQKPGLAEMAGLVGVNKVMSVDGFLEFMAKALSAGRTIHYLPPYRQDTLLFLEEVTAVPHQKVRSGASEEMIRGIVALRSFKEAGEVSQIELAVDICYEMHTTAMRMAQPGIYEREISGRIEGIALAHGTMVSFPIILSMDGQTLHNHYHGNKLARGRMVVADAGAETVLHYAGDITRTFPVGGEFSERQKEIYEIVLQANISSIESVRPGVAYLDIHLDAARVIASGLKGLGLMKGDVDEAVAAGAHAMFYPHGLGHMLGLDVHDMEGLGEDHVGYDNQIKRSDQFGTAYLRLGKKLEPGFVITVEPGIYFIPALIDKWKAEGKFPDFINYEKLEEYKSFGGIRIEDDLLVTTAGCRLLGKPIPKTVTEVEETMRK